MSNETTTVDDARHVLCSVIEYQDDTVNVMPLHRGTLEECQKVAGLISAVTDSTGKPVKCAWFGCPLEAEFDATMAQEK